MRRPRLLPSLAVKSLPVSYGTTAFADSQENICKDGIGARHRSVMIEHQSSRSSATFQPLHDDLSALPIWTFALGVLALLTFGLTSVPAIICGHRALAQTRRSSAESLERSVAITGLVIGYVGVALLGTWMTVVASLFFPR
jgi:hypothetical protein